MRDTTSYNIRNIPRTGKYIVCYKRGWLSGWKHYMKQGRAREFSSYLEALNWLNRKGVGYIQLRLVK